jgi:hypothetical protein
MEGGKLLGDDFAGKEMSEGLNRLRSEMTSLVISTARSLSVRFHIPHRRARTLSRYWFSSLSHRLSKDVERNAKSARAIRFRRITIFRGPGRAVVELRCACGHARTVVPRSAIDSDQRDLRANEWRL